MKLARLKPRNPKRGHMIVNLVFEGRRFRADEGWYKVSDETARALAQIRQERMDPGSPFAFDICTKEEALALEREERRAARRRRTVEDAIRYRDAETGEEGFLETGRETGRGDMSLNDLPEHDDEPKPEKPKKKKAKKRRAPRKKTKKKAASKKKKTAPKSE